MKVDKSRIISLADKVFSIFLNEECTEMQMSAFELNWNKSFKNQTMNKSILSTLPFIKIIEYDLDDDDYNSDNDEWSSSISLDSNAHEIEQPFYSQRKSPQTQEKSVIETSPLIIVNIEQDDCCNFCKLGKQCTLIHVLSKNNYCSEFEKSGSCSNFQCKLFHRPNIKLIQRLIDCFKSKDKSTMRLNELITYHNELYPQFISHSPTVFGITARCSSTFECKSQVDAPNSNEFIIDWKRSYYAPHRQHRTYQSPPQSVDSSSFSLSNTNQIKRKSPIIPEQTEMFKIFMKLEKEWIDHALIKELLQHFKKHSKIRIQDMYIPRRNRSGYVTFKHKTAAAKFMSSVNSPKSTLKCGGRTVSVRKPTIQSVSGNDSSIKLHIKNIGCCVSFPQFVKWCNKNIDTPDIYNMQLVNNTVTEGAGYGILIIENEIDGKQFIKDLDEKEFRGERLTFSPWIEPVEYKQNASKLYSRFRERRNSTPSYVNHKSKKEYIWKYGSPSSQRRHSMPTNALTTMMGNMNVNVDVDYEQRKTMSRLKKRHSLSSDPRKKSSPSPQLIATPLKLAKTPPGLMPMKPTAGKPVSESIDIPANIGFKEWLCDIAKCGEYYDKFINAGFDSMDEMDLSLVTHSVLKEVGVMKIGHRVKILKAIEQYRNVVG